MSGIVGILNLDGAAIDEYLLTRLTESLRFRGPDGEQMWTRDAVGFGHTLLSTTGKYREASQPFTFDGVTWIVADARIDAREELLWELEAKGLHVEADAGDAELILRAYQIWKEDCAQHLLGDFAFGIWDESTRRLYCARDQLGVKPVFYAQTGKQLIFSNTLDCLRQAPFVSDGLNDLAIADFLLFGVNQDARTTSFADIKRLPAGHWATWSSQSAEVRRYWEMPIDEPLYLRRPEAYTERLTNLLNQAVSDRLRTKQVGILLSGGLDSPALAAITCSILRQQEENFKVQAITSVYERLIPDSEGHYAALVAKHLGISIEFDKRDDEPSLENWDQIAVQTSEPVPNPPASLASLDFFRTAGRHARVFLYGEGPDNALLYEWQPYLRSLLHQGRLLRLGGDLVSHMYRHRRLPLLTSIPNILRKRKHAENNRPLFPGWLNENFVERWGLRDRWNEMRTPATSSHPFRPLAYANLSSVLWTALFEDCDINGAWGNLEMRYPFVDLRVLRYLLALPPLPWCRNKHILRRAMAGRLPKEVLKRRKSPVLGDADYERVHRFGFPEINPTPELLEYVVPERVPRIPATPLELRFTLRVPGLNYWLQHSKSAVKIHQEETV